MPANVALVELHIPPVVELLNVTAEPTQTFPDPVIAATIGKAFTVVVFVAILLFSAVQELASV